MLNNIFSYEEVVYPERMDEKEELNPEQSINNAVDSFLLSGKPYSEFPDYILYELNEGVLARVVGGLTGLALGKAIGKFLVKIFKINDDSVLYKIFTSRLFYMAIGAAFGRETSGGRKKVKG